MLNPPKSITPIDNERSEVQCFSALMWPEVKVRAIQSSRTTSRVVNVLLSTPHAILD